MASSKRRVPHWAWLAGCRVPAPERPAPSELVEAAGPRTPSAGPRTPSAPPLWKGHHRQSLSMQGEGGTLTTRAASGRSSSLHG